tara:strand:+ start:847 stop:1356 length:510 start_codon:yes stop_codon:yes gene_type:complete
MSKIKFLILLSSIIFFTSCSLKFESEKLSLNKKFSIDYLSGGSQAFLFKNILKQQLIANNLYSPASLNIIKLGLNADSQYLSTSITKVASRKSEKLVVSIQVFDQKRKDCLLFENNYEGEQSFLLADSNANLSNVAAADNIFIINSENISYNIIDDLLLKDNQKCVHNE